MQNIISNRQIVSPKVHLTICTHPSRPNMTAIFITDFKRNITAALANRYCEYEYNDYNTRICTRTVPKINGGWVEPLYEYEYYTRCSHHVTLNKNWRHINSAGTALVVVRSSTASQRLTSCSWFEGPDIWDIFSCFNRYIWWANMISYRVLSWLSEFSSLRGLRPYDAWNVSGRFA